MNLNYNPWKIKFSTSSSLSLSLSLPHVARIQQCALIPQDKSINIPSNEGNRCRYRTRLSALRDAMITPQPLSISLLVEPAMIRRAMSYDISSACELSRSPQASYEAAVSYTTCYGSDSNGLTDPQGLSIVVWTRSVSTQLKFGLVVWTISLLPVRCLEAHKLVLVLSERGLFQSPQNMSWFSECCH